MKRSSRAFTLVEMLVVMAIIAVLAGLILSGAGFAQKKAARSRADAEIRGMEAALESYKADNGIYPAPSTNDAPSNNPKPEAARALYQALSGDGQDALEGGDSAKKSDGKTDSGSKQYMEFKPTMLGGLDANKKVTAGTYVQDPFGKAYGYYVPTKGPPEKAVVNNPTFDMWSTGGKAGNKPEDLANWITNW